MGNIIDILVMFIYVPCAYYFHMVTQRNFRDVSSFLYTNLPQQASMFKTLQLYNTICELQVDQIVIFHGILDLPFIGLLKDGTRLGSMSICSCCPCLGQFEKCK
jgi:hypothetical protein